MFFVILLLAIVLLYIIWRCCCGRFLHVRYRWRLFHGYWLRKWHVRLWYRKRIYGASVQINKKRLVKNKKKGVRDRYVRQNAFVPGFNTVQSHRFYGDVKYALWHRTHLLPFRYSLSEDEYGLLVAGTNYTNAGIIKGVNPDRTSVNNKVKELKHLIDKHKPLKKRFDKKPETQPSLDVVERLVDWYVNRYSHDKFRYIVLCQYNKSNKSDIPDRFRLILLQNKVLVFDITIANTHVKKWM